MEGVNNVTRRGRLWEQEEWFLYFVMGILKIILKIKYWYDL